MMLRSVRRLLGSSALFLVIAAATGNVSAAVWKSVSPIPKAVDVNAITLGDNRVLVSYAATSASTGTWLYDPILDRWADGPSVPGACGSLVPVAASATEFGALCLIEAPGSGPAAYLWLVSTVVGWSPTEPMIRANLYRRVPVPLADGRVLVAGGTFGGAPATDAELYDPKTKKWTALASAPSASTPSSQDRHFGTELFDKRVLFFGGAPAKDGDARPLTAFYDPSANTWTTSSAGVLPAGTYVHSLSTTSYGLPIAFTFAKGDFAAVGIDTVTGNWKQLAFASQRTLMSASNAGRNNVLLFTRATTGSLSLALPQILDAKDGRSRMLPAQSNGVATPSALAFARDRVFAFGGPTVGGSLPSSAVDVLLQLGDGSSCTDPGNCASMGCVAGKCSPTCEFASECAPGAFCRLVSGVGTCTISTMLGGVCTTSEECVSGGCVDGSCCAVAKGCAPYRCGAAGCLTSCTADADCSNGGVCLDRACVSKDGAHCGGDGRQSIPNDVSKSPTECGPFKCASSTGLCATTCAAKSDCDGTFDCIEGKCVAARAEAASDSGGCVLGRRPASAHGGLELLGGLLLLGLSRSRRDRLK